MREPVPGPGCPDGADLTAHAHGEGDAAARAQTARHLLACPACRAAHDADAALLLELGALGAARSLPPAPQPSRPGRRRLAVLLPPVAAAVLVALTLLVPREPLSSGSLEGTPTPTSAARGGRSPRLAQLLGSQAEDGHWAAEASPWGSDPPSTTALVLLALVHEREAALARGAPVDEPLDLAIRGGSRWLVTRLGRPDAALQALAPAQRAVILAALARCATTSDDPTLASPSHALLDDLGRRLAQRSIGSDALPWVDYALAAAERIALPGAAATRRSLAELDDHVRPPLQRPTPSLAPEPGSAPDCTPLRSAIELLRDEPPVRTLALGPACRPLASVSLR